MRGSICCVVALLLTPFLPTPIHAQQDLRPDPSSPDRSVPVRPVPGPAIPVPVIPGVERLAGEDPASHIAYVRLLLHGSLIGLSAIATPETPLPAPPPTLTAQCTLRPSGKYLFELFADFGGITDRAFYPPWKPASEQDLFPPRTQKVTITMDFLGYTHVKPVRRQWEIPVNTPGQFRYNSPASGSANMEDITFYLRFLLALPTLRLTLDHQAADFLTTPLLDQLRKEPLCRAARL